MRWSYVHCRKRETYWLHRWVEAKKKETQAKRDRKHSFEKMLHWAHCARACQTGEDVDD